jgi:cardiolipin synthase
MIFMRWLDEVTSKARAMDIRSTRSFARRTLGVVLLAIGAAGCAHVYPVAALPSVAVGEPSFIPTVEAYTSAPIVPGNTVELLLNGEQIFPALVAAIRGARHTITYGQYFYEDGAVAREIASALAERCRAGVGVNVLLDSFGALGMPDEYVDLLRRSGCHVAYFRPLARSIFQRASHRNRRRILVVDGRVGFTGGSGVSRKWMGNGRVQDHWRDTDVRMEGPVVEYLQGAFAENWLEASGVVLGGDAYFPRPVPAPGTVHAQVVRSSPRGGSFAMYTLFLLAITSARESISITNPYFVPDDKMREALTQAARRGVRVSVLVPGAIDHNLVRQASRANFGALLKAGVEIHEYRPALLHAKTM